MQKKLNGESLIGIIVGIFILSIVLLGIGNLISYSKDVISVYGNTGNIDVLKNNLTNIVREIDTSGVKENEIFYVYKNNASNTFEVYTGSSNVGYKYVDKYGDKIVDLNAYNGYIYSRILWVEREDETLTSKNQIIRVSLKRLLKK